MSTSAKALNHASSQRRFPALLALFALILLQFSVAAHQFEHSFDHGNEVCQTCSVINESDDAFASTTPPIEFFASAEIVETQVAISCQVGIAANYRSRAPPQS